MKNKFLLPLSLVFTTLLSGCSRPINSLSLFIYSSNDTFMLTLKDELYYRLNNDFKIDVYYGENDQLKQNEQIVEAVNKDSTKALIVNVCDRLAASTIIEKAETKGLPVIFINREPLINDLKGKGTAFYVGTNSTYEGELQGEIANDLFIGPDEFINSTFDRNKNGKLDVVMIKGQQGHQDAELRSKYSLKKLENIGYNVNVLEAAYCNWNVDVSYNTFKTIYEDYGDDIDLVLSNNDDMAIGVANYLKDLEVNLIKEDTNSKLDLPIYKKYFPIIGVDATPIGTSYVTNGDLYGTVKNDKSTQVDAIETLLEFILNDKEFIDFPYTFDNSNFIHIKGNKVETTNI